MRRFICNYIIYIYYKFVFCNHNTMRGSCCLRCIHLLFLLIFLLSISTLSINLYLSTFSINLSLPDLSLSFYVSTSPTSLSHSVTFCHILSHSVTFCHILSHSVTFCHILSHSVTYQLFINSLSTLCQLVSALSTSVAAWRLPLLASQNASTFHDISTFRPFDRFEVPMPQEGRSNAENSPPSCRSQGNVKSLSSRTSKVKTKV